MLVRCTHQTEHACQTMLCCGPYLIPTEVQSCPMKRTDSSHTISSTIDVYHVHTGIRLYVSVVSECVIPHLLSDALWPLSLRPFWKNPAWDLNRHTHTVHLSLPLTLFCTTNRITKDWQYYSIRAGYLKKKKKIHQIVLQTIPL